MHLENGDKKYTDQSDTHKNINEQGNLNEEEIRTLHGKPINVASKLHLNS